MIAKNARGVVVNKKMGVVVVVMKGILDGLKRASQSTHLKVRQRGRLLTRFSRSSKGSGRRAKKKRLFHCLWKEGIFLK